MFGKKKQAATEAEQKDAEQKDKIEAGFDRIEALVAEIEKEQEKILSRLTRKAGALYEGRDLYYRPVYSCTSSNEGLRDAFYAMANDDRNRDLEDVRSRMRKVRRGYRLGRFIESECEA